MDGIPFYIRIFNRSVAKRSIMSSFFYVGNNGLAMEL